MSHRRPDPGQAGLERALRHALRLAVDSVEPTGDGLDRIRARIAARPRAVRTGWPTRHLAGLLAVLSTVWRFGEPAVIWLRYWTGAVTERFRPELGRVGWLGWLRPAAAVATALLVVTGASWAIAALPQAISSAGDSHRYTNQGSGGSTPGSAHHSPQPGSGTGSSTAGHKASPHVSPSCRTSSPAPTGLASSSPAHSPTPSRTPSPSPSPSPSSSSSPSSGSPSPSSSPTGPVPASATVPAQTIQSAISAAIATRPLYLTTKTSARPSPGASGKNSPC